MKTKTKIIKAFLEDRTAKTIKDISHAIGSDYRITHTATQRLIEQGILQSKKLGGSSVCTLNTTHFCSEIFKAQEERKQELLQDQNMNQLYRDISTKLHTSLYILLFSKQQSHFHLVFVSNDPHFEEKVDSILSVVPLPIQTNVMTEQQARELPLSTKNHVILHGVESYYMLKGLKVGQLEV